MKFRRSTYLFEHKTHKDRKIIKAFSREGARKKMRAFVSSKIYGDWAVVVDRVVIDNAMKDITCKRVKGK